MKYMIKSAILLMTVITMSGLLTFCANKNSIQQNKSIVQETKNVTEETKNSIPECKYKIGDKGPAGGWIFYDKGNSNDGWRYLEAAPADLGSAEWGCKGVMAFSDPGMAIGSGKKNTEAIMKSCKGKTAAKLCNSYRGGGKKDWFMPSAEELKLMYENLHKKGIGGFNPANYYWSSSERSNQTAFCQDFKDGYQVGLVVKYIPMPVRAIRAFSE